MGETNCDDCRCETVCPLQACGTHEICKDCPPEPKSRKAFLKWVNMKIEEHKLKEEEEETLYGKVQAQPTQ